MYIGLLYIADLTSGPNYATAMQVGTIYAFSFM